MTQPRPVVAIAGNPDDRGLLHSKPKIDEEELGLTQSRAAARLADLSASRPAPSADGQSTTTSDFLDMVADWIAAGGRSLNKPTHFEVRDGKF